MRTIYTPNKFIFDKQICKIKLYDKFNKEKAETIIDKKYFNKVKYKKWYLSTTGYVFTSNKSDTGKWRLHWSIIGKPPIKYHTDHINRNKLDNRKINLRICTASQNALNRGKQINNTSGYKGVCWDKKNNKWITQLVVNKKRVFHKRFKLLNNAILAYKNELNKYIGSY